MALDPANRMPLDGALPPEAEEPLRSPGGLSGLQAARTYGRLVRMDGTGPLYKKLRPDKSCVP